MLASALSVCPLRGDRERLRVRVWGCGWWARYREIERKGKELEKGIGRQYRVTVCLFNLRTDSNTSGQRNKIFKERFGGIGGRVLQMEKVCI